MPSDVSPTAREREAWRAVRDNILLARSFTEALSAEQFSSDRKTFYAVVRCLEIISEASRRLRGPQQQVFPALPWAQIEAAGNVFRHEYHNVAEERVLETARTGLSDLLAAALEVLGEESPQD